VGALRGEEKFEAATVDGNWMLEWIGLLSVSCYECPWRTYVNSSLMGIVEAIFGDWYGQLFTSKAATSGH
jgi:hypothetical protein